MSAADRVGSERLGTASAAAAVGDRARRIAVNVALYTLAFATALALSALLVVVATDASPGTVFSAMYEGSLKTGAARGLTLDEATPVLIVGLGAVIASRAGIINIGPEGQLLIGATTATAVALHAEGPAWLVIGLTLVAGAAGGALWAGIAALLRFTRGVDVVISTLLLNFIAAEVVSYAVGRPWLLQETTSNLQKLPQSDRIPEELQLPRLGSFPGFNVSSAVFIAAALVVVVAFMMARSRWGFRLKMLGYNPTAARKAGVSVALMGGGALLLSGAFAGLSGGVMLTGTVFRLQPGFSQGIGFNGLLAALIARRNPIAVVPVAFFFGALRAGGGFLASTGVPRFLVDIVQALLVLAALFPPLFLDLARRRRELRNARAAARRTAPVPETVGAAA
ncbi:MAG: hypothetical protein KatS3mg009_0579 [Acidimicrobiia bacterium]|nr:MAG: hypothetical protein KatS3mg009_0579 [Acidimicrobiia bacterium]